MGQLQQLAAAPSASAVDSFARTMSFHSTMTYGSDMPFLSAVCTLLAELIVTDRSADSARRAGQCSKSEVDYGSHAKRGNEPGARRQGGAAGGHGVGAVGKD